MSSVYFDLERLEKFTRIEWERAISIGASQSVLYQPATSANAADLVVLPISARKGDLSRFGDRRVYCWDAGDHPDGYFSGLYCSGGTPFFRPKAHLNFTYPITYNEQVAEFPLNDARTLWSFHGALTSGARRRLVDSLRHHKDGDITISAGPWMRMYDRSGLDVKVDFARALARTKFFICPRGNGLGSIRLFETMKAQRVPVIVADRYALPSYIDWSECALVVKEHDIAGIPDLCRAAEPGWESKARKARAEWVKHFGETTLLDSVGTKLEGLAPSAHSGQALMSLCLAKAERTARRAVIRVRGMAIGWNKWAHGGQ